MSRNRKNLGKSKVLRFKQVDDKPHNTLGGEPMEKVGHDKWVFHGENRRLSVKEIQRIQTFPDWFEFSYGSPLGKSGKQISRNAQIDKVYKQIGNAVPVLLARAIIQPIADFMKENIDSL
ncbi:DNA cytosine methyltransferase [Streptococcus iniae]